MLESTIQSLESKIDVLIQSLDQINERLAINNQSDKYRQAKAISDEPLNELPNQAVEQEVAQDIETSYDLETCKTLAIKLAKNTPDALVKVLEKFKAARVTELKTDQLNAFGAEIEALLGAN